MDCEPTPMTAKIPGLLPFHFYLIHFYLFTLPMGRPPRALQLAQPAVGFVDRQIARRELPGEESRAIVREADFHAGGGLAYLRVDPGVIFADAPEAFCHFRFWTPLVLSLSKDERQTARGSTSSPRACEHSSHQRQSVIAVLLAVRARFPTVGWLRLMSGIRRRAHSIRLPQARCRSRSPRPRHPTRSGRPARPAAACRSPRATSRTPGRRSVR